MNTPAEVCRTLSCGVYVIGVAADGLRRAFTAAWLVQVSFDPLLVALSIHPRHRSYPILRQGGGFTINVLASHQQELARHFGQPSTDDKLAGHAWRPGRSGAPILPEALAWLECELHHQYPAGDHELVIGQVIDGALQHPEHPPLLYRETGDMDGASRLFPDTF